MNSKTILKNILQNIKVKDKFLKFIIQYSISIMYNY